MDEVSKAMGVALAETSRVLHALMKTAVEQSPDKAIDMLADYLADVGIDDQTTLAHVDEWRKRKP
jgi:hypothetical protein